MNHPEHRCALCAEHAPHYHSAPSRPLAMTVLQCEHCAAIIERGGLAAHRACCAAEPAPPVAAAAAVHRDDALALLWAARGAGDPQQRATGT